MTEGESQVFQGTLAGFNEEERVPVPLREKRAFIPGRRRQGPPQEQSRMDSLILDTTPLSSVTSERESITSEHIEPEVSTEQEAKPRWEDTYYEDYYHVPRPHEAEETQPQQIDVGSILKPVELDPSLEDGAVLARVLTKRKGWKEKKGNVLVVDLRNDTEFVMGREDFQPRAVTEAESVLHQTLVRRKGTQRPFTGVVVISTSLNEENGFTLTNFIDKAKEFSRPMTDFYVLEEKDSRLDPDYTTHLLKTHGIAKAHQLKLKNKEHFYLTEGRLPKPRAAVEVNLDTKKNRRTWLGRMEEARENKYGLALTDTSEIDSELRKTLNAQRTYTALRDVMGVTSEANCGCQWHVTTKGVMYQAKDCGDLECEGKEPYFKEKKKTKADLSFVQRAINEGGQAPLSENVDSGNKCPHCQENLAVIIVPVSNKYTTYIENEDGEREKVEVMDVNEIQGCYGRAHPYGKSRNYMEETWKKIPTKNLFNRQEIEKAQKEAAQRVSQMDQEKVSQLRKALSHSLKPQS